MNLHGLKKERKGVAGRIREFADDKDRKHLVPLLEAKRTRLGRLIAKAKNGKGGRKK